MNTSAIIIALKGVLDSDTIPANDRLEMVAELVEKEALGSGITQALAERQRCIGIIEAYLKHSSHNPYDTCLENIIKEIKNV